MLNGILSNCLSCLSQCVDAIAPGLGINLMPLTCDSHNALTVLKKLILRYRHGILIFNNDSELSLQKEHIMRKNYIASINTGMEPELSQNLKHCI